MWNLRTNTEIYNSGPTCIRIFKHIHQLQYERCFKQQYVVLISDLFKRNEWIKYEPKWGT